MIDYSDAKYILGELRNIAYYEAKISALCAEIDRIEQEIALLSSPRSVAFDKPRAGRVSVKDTENHTEEKMLSLITIQQSIEKEIKDWKARLKYATGYRYRLLHSESHDFVADFLSGMPYSQLEKKYYISHPFDKITRIIMNECK